MSHETRSVIETYAFIALATKKQEITFPVFYDLYVKSLTG